jgi:hypothetical protein
MGSAAEPSCGHALASTMVERITETMSHADALKELRSAFPDSPLAVRVAALAMLWRRGAGDPPYMPR